MKPLLKSSFFLFLGIVVMLFGCQKVDTGCHDPQLVKWYNQANIWMVQPFKVGDSVKFNVYRKDKTNGGKYVFLKNETFTVSDTTTRSQNDPNPDKEVNCNDEITNNYKVVNFKGPELLSIELAPGQITEMYIYIKNKGFDIGSDQMNYHHGNYYAGITIGGNLYNDVKYFPGFAPHSNDNPSTYVDSTYAFYNLQNGILKLILNDTMIYQRKLP